MRDGWKRFYIGARKRLKMNLRKGTLNSNNDDTLPIVDNDQLSVDPEEDFYPEGLEGPVQPTDSNEDHREELQGPIRPNEDHREEFRGPIRPADVRGEDPEAAIRRPPSVDEPTTNSSLRFFLGVFLAFMSGVLFTANNFVIKTLNLDFGEVLTVRCSIQVVVTLVIIKFRGMRIIPESWRDRLLAVAIGFFGGFIMISAFIGVLCMPVGDAMTLIFSSPLFTIMLAAIFLKHRITVIKLISMLGLASGVILVAKPPFLFPTPTNSTLPLNSTSAADFSDILGDYLDRTFELYNVWAITPADLFRDKYFLGACLCLLNAVSGAAVNVCIARLQGLAPVVQLLYMGVAGLFIGVVTQFFDPTDRIFSPAISAISWQTWLELLGLALSGIGGFFMMIQSLSLIPPSAVSALRTCEIVLAFGVQVVIMREIPSLLELLGSGFIILSALAITFENVIKCQRPVPRVRVQ